MSDNLLFSILFCASKKVKLEEKNTQKAKKGKAKKRKTHITDITQFLNYNAETQTL
jgi:hypothetical protein